MDEVIEKGPLYQVWATETRTNKMVAVPFFPRMDQKSIERFVGDMNEMIAKGHEKRYSDPHAILYVEKS